MNVKLEDICEFISGGTPDTKISRYFQGKIPWITGADIIGNIVSKARSYITEEAIEASATNVVPKGNILLVTRTSVGKVAVTGVDICISQDFTGLLPDKTSLNEWFLFYYLVTKQPYFTENQRGATIQGIPREIVANLVIPLPPLPEQQRIAAILAKADRLRRLRRYALDLGESYLQSVFLEMFGDPVTNPMGWKQGELQELASRIVDCPHSTPEYTETQTPYACIRSSDIQNGYLDWSTTKYISYAEYQSRIGRDTPIAGDIIYSREGARFGNAARIPPGVTVCLGQRMMLFRPSPQRATSEFLWALLEHEYTYQQAVRLSGGSASPHVNVGDIKVFDTILPPLALQQKFSTIVKKYDRLRAQQREAVRQAEQLFQTLLQRAFAGGA